MNHKHLTCKINFSLSSEYHVTGPVLQLYYT